MADQLPDRANGVKISIWRYCPSQWAFACSGGGPFCDRYGPFWTWAEACSVASDHWGETHARPAEPLSGDLRTHDTVNHPRHYTSHPSGVECITVTEHMGFNLGNAVKYIWRADLKGDAVEDLRKAAWYLQREIDRRTRAGGAA